MTEIEKLQQRLLKKGTTGFHVCWGSDAKYLTPEERAAYINQMLDAVENGDAVDAETLSPRGRQVAASCKQMVDDGHLSAVVRPHTELPRSERKVDVEELVKNLLCEHGGTVDAQR